MLDYAQNMAGYTPYPSSLSDMTYTKRYEMNYEDAYWKLHPIESYVLTYLGSPWWMNWYGVHENYGCWALSHIGGCTTYY